MELATPALPVRREMLEASPRAPLVWMPDLAGATHAHQHTVDSALVCLAALGVAAQRIVIRRGGRQAAQAGTVVKQHPRPGEPLLQSTIVELEIAGLGFTHNLPVGLWDSGGESVAGTFEILQALDDPLEKLKHWFHEGAPLFRIAPNDPAACTRWLGLFGVRTADWPQRLWYPLASLIAGMPRLSCSERGCAFVLDRLLGLPVGAFTYRAAHLTLPASSLSRLGAKGSRLGIDLLVGDSAEDLARLEIEIGPVPLAVYEHFTESPEGIALLARTLAILMPISSITELKWNVLDATRSPQLGMADRNCRLGINTHMGQGLGALPATRPTAETAAAAAELTTSHTPGSPE